MVTANGPSALIGGIESEKSREDKTLATKKHRRRKKGWKKTKKAVFRCQGTDSIHRRTAETLSRQAKYYADMLENPSKTTVFGSMSAQSLGLHKLTENREAGKPALAIECLCAHD